MGQKKTGQTLTRVRVPGVAWNLSASVSFQCRLSLTVSVQPLCAIACISICAHAKKKKKKKKMAFVSTCTRSMTKKRYGKTITLQSLRHFRAVTSYLLCHTVRCHTARACGVWGWGVGGGGGAGSGREHLIDYSDVHNHLIDCNDGHNYCISLANVTCNHLTVVTVVMN